MQITALSKWIPNLKRPLIISGPCSAESEEQMLTTARELVQIEDVRIFRAGIWKPRTRPGSFEGNGEKALPWLEKVKKETGLLTSCEVANAQHVELALKYNVDVLWIGARTSANPFAVQEIADALKGTNIPVMVKNPINADLALWIGAIERMSQAGITKLAAIHRGFSTYEKIKYRNNPIWKIPIELKQRMPELPIICDPSHIAGRRNLVAELCQKAMDLDMDGLMIESHINPKEAWSDAAQQVTPEYLAGLLKGLSLRSEFSPNRTFDAELEELRGQIDRVDTEIIESLKSRMDIVEKIGLKKALNKVTPLQMKRMDELMDKRQASAEALGLDTNYIKELYKLVHVESIRKQTHIMNDLKEQEDK